MITFFATLLVNVLIGTVFYLVISLKLEKSASELHVKKIRREMDEMIREFNMTADRNISLLENKILVMKRLLERNGISSGFEDVDGGEINIAAMIERPEPDSITDNAKGKKGKKTQSKGAASKAAALILEKVSGKSSRSEMSNQNIKKTNEPFSVIDNSTADTDTGVFSMVKSEADLKKMFKSSTERYARYEMVRSLFEEGYPVETLSRLSGIPAGELSLVVNLPREKQ